MELLDKEIAVEEELDQQQLIRAAAAEEQEPLVETHSIVL
jgi:hypothetical protein